MFKNIGTMPIGKRDRAARPAMPWPLACLATCEFTLTKRGSAVLQWEIDGRVRWLCTACTRKNSHVFLMHQAKFLGEERDSAHVCYCCRCADRVVERYGRWRWLYFGFCWLFGLAAPERVKSRRSK